MPESTPGINADLPPEKKDRITIPRTIMAGSTTALFPEAKRLKTAHDKLSTTIEQTNIFEPGMHLIDQKDIDSVIDKFSHGDPDAHFWSINPEMTARLASYSPRVLTMDSLPITPNGYELNKMWIWLNLPCRPRRINQLGFYTISGDAGYYTQIAKNLAAWGQKPYDTSIDSNMKSIFERDKNNFVYDDHILNQRKNSVAALVGSCVLLITGGYVNSKLSSQEKTQSIKRRTFLKGLVGGAALLATTGLLKETKATLQKESVSKSFRSTTEQQKEFWQTLTAYSEDMPSDVWLDGRTAMLIAKHEDTMDFLHPNYLSEKTKGAIGMGSRHAYKASLYMHDKLARNAAILAYAEHTTNIANKFIYDHYNFSTLQREQLTGHLLNYIAAVEINHVSDPGIPPGTNLIDYVDTNIQPISALKSKQVDTAIQSLRPA